MMPAMTPAVPEIRIRPATREPIQSHGKYVLYWMTAFRRLHSNFALQRAVEWAVQLERPLLILEALRVSYPWACDRFHRFIVDGMRDHAREVASTRAGYLAYVEPRRGDGHALAQTLAEQACAVVTDDFPCFFHPALYQRIVRKWRCRVELVDSNGILPIHAADRTFTVAHSYRRYMQKSIAAEAPVFPADDPLNHPKLPPWKGKVASLAPRWKFLSAADLDRHDLSALPIDHSVAPTGERGGRVAALECLHRFVSKRLGNYADDRNEPEVQGSSHLSPYLHFGHVSPHEVFQAVAGASPEWSLDKIGKPNGKMTGFWKLGENTEAFMDQLMTWREIGFNMCAREPNYDRYESLPGWAQATLAEHAADPRPKVYSLDQFDRAQTYDPLWNAAQTQLVREGRIHNYLRMLWGKKILHWSESPQAALEIMIHLNNKYALDGRDPNSYSGIFWVLGRYDRAWGPERPIFGKIRYMTSESTRSKYSVKAYLQKYS
ncbi:MAG: deoxyribodipyrimidine photolyase [Planctomycetota bacterium]|jgi:deoxyribodipyrimidine photo-lyase